MREQLEKYMQGDAWQWLTKDGQELHIQDMETSHILNCMKMIEKIGFVSNQILGGETYSQDYWCEELEHDYTPVYNNMALELRLRNLEQTK